MNGLAKIIRTVFVYSWGVFVTIPAINTLVKGIVAMFNLGSGEIDIVAYYSSVIFVVIFVLGLILIAILYLPEWLKKRKAISQTGQIKEDMAYTIRIDSSDLVKMDAKQIRALFDGLSKLPNKPKAASK